MGAWEGRIMQLELWSEDQKRRKLQERRITSSSTCLAGKQGLQSSVFTWLHGSTHPPHRLRPEQPRGEGYRGPPNSKPGYDATPSAWVGWIMDHGCMGDNYRILVRILKKLRGRSACSCISAFGAFFCCFACDCRVLTVNIPST